LSPNDFTRSMTLILGPGSEFDIVRL